MSHHLILLAHATPAVAPMFGAACAARGFDVDVVPIRSPYAGMSAAYDALAQACLRDGRVLPGLLAKYKPPRQGYASTWLVCWSGSYALARAMRPADRAELAGLVLLDGGHTLLEADGTALDAGVAWLVDWAREAKAGRCTVAIHHTDVRTYGNTASTTQVAAEVLRLVGGQGGRFLVEGHNVAAKDKDEHVAARDGWGPTAVADAMASALLGAAPPAADDRDTPEPPSTEREPPRLLRRGARGSDVADWARRLIALGYDPGSPDGAFGPLVENATKTFQRDLGLVADGVVGPKTLAAAELARPKPPPPAPPKGLAAALLARAQADLEAGIVETAPNDGSRIRAMLDAVGVGWPDNWCAAAATDWIRGAAADLQVEPPVRGSAGALALMAQFEQAERFIPAAELREHPELLEPGMIGFETRGSPGSGKGHTYAVETRATGTKFTSIDGNGGPQGDRVARTPRDLRDPRFLGVGKLS
ncbi:peptidoglycan-binding domain-containing protein [Sorangium sp. So ce388]|uniref:peptidoglycan-binding domain-containing protein n=1 Tax=Sorangium sp. So ce388 TaxID=3133309 RepID=UPI003F5B457F